MKPDITNQPARPQAPPDAKLPTPDVKPIAAALPDTMAMLAQMAEESRKFAAQWRAWYATRPMIACSEHPGHTMELNEEASLARSWGERRNLVVFHDCPDCAVMVKDAGQNIILRRAGVPEDMLHCSLTNWSPRTPEDKATLESVRRYAANPQGALILLGKDFGVGKTHLGIAVMRTFSYDHRSLLFFTHTAFMKDIRDGYGDPRAKDIIGQCVRTSLLMIDDLGVSSGGRDELPSLHQVLDERKGGDKPFILTSNVPNMAALEALVGARMMDRLREFTADVRVLSGKSMRKARF